MKQEIKPSQYMFLMIGFSMGSFLLISFMITLTKQDSWIVAILGYLVFIPFILAYVYLGKRFQEKNLIQIHDILYGRFLGKLVSIFYILYFFSLLAFNLRDVSVYYTSYIMPETPQVFFIIIFGLLCAYAVKKGIHCIAKISIVTVAFVGFVVILTTFLLIGKMDLKNFLPVLETPADKMYQATQIMTTIPYGEIVLFLMVIPYVKDKTKLAKYSISAVGIVAALYVIVIIRNFSVLGASGTIYTQPSFQAVRLINVGDFLNRIEALIALNNTIFMFIKISVIYFATVKSLSQLFNLKTYRPLIIPVGSIAIIYALVAHGSSNISHAEWGNKYGSFFEIPFVVIFPLLSVLIAKLRKPKVKEGEKKAAKAQD